MKTVYQFGCLMILLIIVGCSGSPVEPAFDDQVLAALGDPPSLTGVVGNYTYTGNDGSVDSGLIVRDDEGDLSLISDRGASVLASGWFGVDVKYLNPVGWYQGKYAIFRRGMTMQYELTVHYNRNIPLDMYPILYSKFTCEQRYWPSKALLPGESVEVWNPFLIDTFSHTELYDEYYIPLDCYFSWGCTTAHIYVFAMQGWYEFALASSICGVWDP